MRMTLPALLLAACASHEARAPQTVQEPGTIVGEAELAVGRTVAVASPRALLLELKPGGAMPERLASEMGAGRSWLSVERPRAFSFAGRDLLEGKGPFHPGGASFLFVQPREGAPAIAEPALLRLTGRVDRATVASRIETIAAPGPGEDFQSVGGADLRVLLGHGLDVLLGCVGSGDLDTHHWVRLVDAAGEPAALKPALEEALAGEGLEALAPYRVLVRRRTPGDPYAAHFRVRLDDVVVAAQARVVEREGALDWTWEGVWSARLAPPPSEGPNPWPKDAPPLEVRYKEYVRPPAGTDGSFWRTLLAPVALGADVGAAFLEGDGPLIDSVRERQRRGD
ncbi:MAG TPA: hypothetical protein VFY93_20100 [Planctomycetota bacterium]|nr:hypothetical protein [Planctomycetota bacterium]